LKRNTEEEKKETSWDAAGRLVEHSWRAVMGREREAKKDSGRRENSPSSWMAETSRNKKGGRKGNDRHSRDLYVGGSSKQKRSMSERKKKKQRRGRKDRDYIPFYRGFDRPRRKKKEREEGRKFPMCWPI